MQSLARIRLPAAAGRASGYGRSATLHTSRRWAAPLAPVAAPMAPTAARRAEVGNMYGTGPPPDVPVAADDQSGRAAVAEEQAAAERSARIARRAAGRKDLARQHVRPWKTVQVMADDPEGGLLLALDGRTVRHPTTRRPLRLPGRKRLLAHALAVEWDHLLSVRQAAQGYRVPLMSLVCRAVDLETEASEASKASGTAQPLHTALIQNLLRYLDTDSLLCWEAEGGEPRSVTVGRRGPDNAPQSLTLHQLQARTAAPILAFVRKHVWPGAAVEAVLGSPDWPSLFLPRPHPPEVREAARRWLASLDAWDLAGVERATLAGKSLVVAARLVGGLQRQRQQTPPAPPEFGAEDAVSATNSETAFQTALWGEVEDTHDVEAADMRRHFGSVVMLVAE